MYRTVFWTLWERERVGWFGRMALKHVKYHIWNKLPVQVWCMTKDAWGWCTGMTQRDGMRREEGEGFRMGNTCTPVADSCWCVAKPIQYCKVISPQLKQINLYWKNKLPLLSWNKIYSVFLTENNFQSIKYLLILVLVVESTTYIIKMAIRSNTIVFIPPTANCVFMAEFKIMDYDMFKFQLISLKTKKLVLNFLCSTGCK